MFQCVTCNLHVTGLQYVWEYRSPSKSVPPHYHCKLCAVSHLQQDMLAHVKGWKHCLKYLVSIACFPHRPASKLVYCCTFL